jgi:aspartokinase
MTIDAVVWWTVALAQEGTDAASEPAPAPTSGPSSAATSRPQTRPAASAKRFVYRASGTQEKNKAVLVIAEQESMKLLADPNVAKISVVGVGMRSHAGVASTMFRALADKAINIQVISTSEIKVSVLIAADYTELAVRALHTAYGLDAA